MDEDEPQTRASLTSAQRVPFPASLWTWLRSWWSERGAAGLTPVVQIRIQVTDPTAHHAELPFRDVTLVAPVVPAQGEWIWVEGLNACVVERAWSVAEGKLSVLLRAQVNP